MALLTDDCDLRDTTFWMEHGGNGDFYINLMQFNDYMMGEKFQKLNFRFAMSGGNTQRHDRVRSAIIELYRALEEAGLNNHPEDDNLNKQP